MLISYIDKQSVRMSPVALAVGPIVNSYRLGLLVIGFLITLYTLV